MVLLTWCFAVSLVTIFMVFSFLLYFKGNRGKDFLCYGWYCLLLLSYLNLKTNFFTDSEGLFFKAFNWYVQILYLNVYLSFGVHFTDIGKQRPGLFKRLSFYQWLSVGIGSLLFLACITGMVSINFFIRYFNFVFLPVHLVVAVVFLYIIVRSKSPIRYFFFAGSIVYVLLSMWALWLTMNNIFDGPLKPIVYFYLAIIIECLLFTFGLAYKVRLMYVQKALIQNELLQAQMKIQDQMEQDILLSQQQNARLKDQKEKQELATQLAELQTTVLRSQMNSHFVFNVLNSIKLFILENDSRQAAQYLNKFAKFIRKILDGSIYENTTLKEEVETLSLYLSIECTRFNHTFTYHIDMDEDLNTDAYIFPALLLQPFVENALWHGVMKSEGDKKLVVMVRKHADYLSIIIDDNGPGIRSSKNSKVRDDKHKSYGIEITERRIQEFNAKNSARIDYAIIDKSDAGRESGTEVEVRYYYKA